MTPYDSFVSRPSMNATIGSSKQSDSSKETGCEYGVVSLVLL